MDRVKLNTFRSVFTVLLILVVVIIVLIFFNSLSVFELNEQITDNAVSLYLIGYPILLSVLLLFLFYNIFKLMRAFYKFSDEVEKYNEERFFGTQNDNISDIDGKKKSKESKSTNVFNEVWETLDKKLKKNDLAEQFLIGISKKLEVVQGLFYIGNSKNQFTIAAKYAYYAEEEPKSFTLGEGLSGQVAKDMKPMNLNELPERYVKILSGLGSSSPNNLLILPVIHNNKTVGIIELASFVPFDLKLDEFVEFLKEISNNFISSTKE